MAGQDPTTQAQTQAQAALWNTTSGCAWVENQPLLDQLLQPFEDTLMDAIRSGSSTRLLDIGCGTGSTTLAAARLLGQQGRCTGIDISEPMLALARSRAEREHLAVNFICADAQTHAFDANSFDTIISRFGVMFFDDPTAAFANLRRAAMKGARLCFVAWRGAADNPFMTTAERAAAPLLPNIPPRKPDAPGQFGFADSERVRRILDHSGWAEIELRPLDVGCRLPEPELIGYFTKFGPLGQVLQQADPATRNHVIATVRAAFDPYVHGAEVRFDAGAWVVTARA
jgi:SAM-dependent methyltransferase